MGWDKFRKAEIYFMNSMCQGHPRQKKYQADDRILNIVRTSAASEIIDYLQDLSHNILMV